MTVRSGLHVPSLDLLVDWIVHAEAPAVGCEKYLEAIEVTQDFESQPDFQQSESP